MAIQAFLADVMVPNPTGAHTAAAANRANAHLRCTRWSVPATTIVGDAGSSIAIVTLPYGARYCSQLSKLGWKGFGTGRTLNAGWLAYTLGNGTQMPANLTGVGTGLDVAADGRSFFDSFPGSSADELAFEAPVTIVLTVLGGTIPIGTTMGGLLCYLIAS